MDCKKKAGTRNHIVLHDAKLNVEIFFLLFKLIVQLYTCIVIIIFSLTLYLSLSTLSLTLLNALASSTFTSKGPLGSVLSFLPSLFLTLFLDLSLLPAQSLLQNHHNQHLNLAFLLLQESLPSEPLDLNPENKTISK